jgi:hypothetical protein
VSDAIFEPAFDMTIDLETISTAVLENRMRSVIGTV